MLAPVGRSVFEVSFTPATILDCSSGSIPAFMVSTIDLSMGAKFEVFSGGSSIRDVNLFWRASTISAGVIPNDSSLGTSKGSLKRQGELHRNVPLFSTNIAVEADIYLKKLVRSWRRFGERCIRFPCGCRRNWAAVYA